MQAGQKVRLKQNPGKVGVLTGQSKSRGGRTRLQVQFPVDSEWLPSGSLELIEENESLDAVELLEKGRFGKVEDLRRALTHSRLSGKLADLIYSMNTTNTDFYAYQYKPVLNFLNSPCQGLLIADEVGLGKTIEAGLIWTELRARLDARRLLVLCPAMLREKWRDELSARFGINAEIGSASDLLDKLQRLRRGDIHEFVVVASMQGLRPPKNWDDEEQKGSRAELARLLDECAIGESLFDAVIIDEAHYLRNPESQTAALGRLLRPVSDNLILLSATPIQIRSDDLFHLLNLLDEDTFHHLHSFDDILSANEPILKLRDRVLSNSIDRADALEMLTSAQKHILLRDNRQIQQLIDVYPSTTELMLPEKRSEIAERLERINLLGQVVTRTRKSEVHEFRVIRVPIAEKVALNPLEEEIYNEVTNCVRSYCTQYDAAEGFLLTIPQRQMSSSIPAAYRTWQRKLGNFEQQAIDELAYEDTGEEFQEKRQTTRNNLGPLVTQLMSISQNLGIKSFEELKNHDSKYQRLISQLSKYWQNYPDKKVVLFAYYRDTLEYLEERLKDDGVYPVRLVGGMKESKYDIIEQFKSPEGPQILLSSEVASEGVDLQFASVLINYDLPWNPMRIEQRIGRIDRLGQKASRISIWNLFYANTIDDRVYDRLFDRLGIFTQALGSIEAVLGDSIRQMSFDLLKHDLDEDQELKRIDQTRQALSNLKHQEKELERQAAHLVAHGDYILNQVKAAQELNRYVTSDDLWVYFRNFFSNVYPGCQFTRVDEGTLTFTIDLSAEAKVDFNHYLDAQKLRGKTRLIGASGSGVRYIFENRTGKATTGCELMNQYHPVFRFIATQFREGKDSYHPLAAIRLSSVHLPSIPAFDYYFVVQRWLLSGERDTEKLVFKAIPLSGSRLSESNFLSDQDSERLISEAANHGEEWLGAGNIINLELAGECDWACLDDLEASEKEYFVRNESENHDRINLQITTVETHAFNQIEKIEATIEKHRLQGREKMIPANLGRIRKIRENKQAKLIQLEKKRSMTLTTQRVCSGVIGIYE